MFMQLQESHSFYPPCTSASLYLCVKPLRLCVFVLKITGDKSGDKSMD